MPRAVHPESYPLVQSILADIKHGHQGSDRRRQSCSNRSTRPQYADEQFGVPTIRTSCSELEKPGRDPRPEFTTATFREGVEDLKDLQART